MIGRRVFLRLFFCSAFVLLTLTSRSAFAQNGGELRFCLRSEPKTFDPALVDDDSSLSIRYLTGGVLVRANRKTQDRIVHVSLCFNKGYGMHMVGKSTLCTDVKVRARLNSRWRLRKKTCSYRCCSLMTTESYAG